MSSKQSFALQFSDITPFLARPFSVNSHQRAVVAKRALVDALESGKPIVHPSFWYQSIMVM